jgi:probable lipoprotein (TIGR04455 family)
MSILKFKKILQILSFLLFVSCSSTQITESTQFKELFPNTKRVVIALAEKSNLTQSEGASLVEIFQEQLKHHKEYIVYPLPKASLKCDIKKFPKIEGIFFLQASQKLDTENSRLYLDFEVSLMNCKTGLVIWRGLRKDWFPLKNQGNESLKKTYVQKYGPSVENRVSPYFWMSQAILEDIPNPNLSPEEEDEKIEVESN